MEEATSNELWRYFKFADGKKIDTETVAGGDGVMIFFIEFETFCFEVFQGVF